MKEHERCLVPALAKEWIEIEKSHGFNLDWSEDIPIIEGFLEARFQK